MKNPKEGKMRKSVFRIFWLTGFFGLAINFAHGQVPVPFSQYYQNPQILNPAFAGIEDYWSVNLGYRHTPVKGLAAKTYTAGFNGVFPLPATRGNDPLLNTIKGSDNDAVVNRQRDMVYRGLRTRHGIGGVLYNQEVDSYSNILGEASYAIHVPLSFTSMLSLGLGSFFFNSKLGIDDWVVRDTEDELYRRLKDEGGKINDIYIQGGVVWHAQKFYVGYSFSQMIQSTSYSFNDDDLSQTGKHLLTAGYKHRFSQDWMWLSSVFTHYSKEKDVTFAGATQLDYKEMFRVGALYSQDEFVTGMLGFSAKNRLRVDYSYSHPVGGNYSLGSNKGSHELSLSFFFYKKSGVERYFW
ncbi:hypothetical protein FUAX_16430 [Fulvitalea axinellae]|uniref:Type IX secretion system membrane protein PorP/SprF n=1 Tax=Fulvitalea axinellae TaxID=1182444 RepID=A0AAU9CJW3_9BACT|nr:hypothetical protein FUAX_16430 [Fulvitalea axinellae]